MQLFTESFAIVFRNPKSAHLLLEVEPIRLSGTSFQLVGEEAAQVILVTIKL